ncbi:hypothetical protein LINGRAHAP2_LOCUS13979, partial [Linum grandiflorum]
IQAHRSFVGVHRTVDFETVSCKALLESVISGAFSSTTTNFGTSNRSFQTYPRSPIYSISFV